MAVIVSDTSPLRCFHHLGRLHLLVDLFGEVFVPPAVSAELTKPRPRFLPIDVGAIAFVRVRAPSDDISVAGLRRQFGPGEAEAIVLASELGAELIIDEADGRAEAKRRGILTVGVLGLLVRCKQNNLIDSVMPPLLRLRDELGFFLSEALLEEARRLAGER
jgi:predicted nucleic acid-binding protein